MAKSSRSPAKKSPARKAAKKAPAKRRPAAKSTKSVARAPSKAAKKAAPAPVPDHTGSLAARKVVARPTKAHHEAQVELKAEHDHHDPRLAGIPGVSHEGRKLQPENYGQFKNKHVGHLDKPVNWFRRAAKPKQ